MWGLRRWTAHAVVVAAAVLLALAVYYADGKFPSNPCQMSYMDVKFTRVPVSSKYGYGLYRALNTRAETAKATPPTINKLKPVLFVPGNAGDVRQARTLASQVNSDTMVVYAIDFHSQYSALSGLLLHRQAQFVQQALDTIADLHSNSHRKITVVGHSMGAVAAWPAVFAEREGQVDRLFALCAPLQRPGVGLRHLEHFYADHVVAATSAVVAVVSVGCGRRDVLVPSSLSLVPGDMAGAGSLQVLASSVVGFSIDHQAILWCKQFSTRLANAVSSDVHVDLAQVFLPPAAAAAAGGSAAHNLTALRDRMAGSETYQFGRNPLELFVFAVRGHWTRLLPAVLAVLCLAVRETTTTTSEEGGWFFPPALHSLQRTSLVFAVLPFGLLLPDFWVSLWLTLAAVGLVTAALWTSRTMSRLVAAACGGVPRVVVRCVLVMAVSLAVGVVAVTAGERLDVAFCAVYVALVWLAGFWFVVVDGNGSGGVWALGLALALLGECEVMLLCMEAVVPAMMNISAPQLTAQEQMAVLQSLACLSPWFVLAWVSSSASSRAVGRPSPPQPKEEAEAEEEEEEEEYEVDPRPVQQQQRAPPRAAPLGGAAAAELSTAPWGADEVLEFHSDVDYADKSTSALVRCNQGEVVQVDDLVCRHYEVEKHADAVSIINPTRLRKKKTAKKPVAAVAPVAAAVEEIAVEWPKWTVWTLQLTSMACVLRPDLALQVLSPLASLVLAGLAAHVQRKL